MDGKNLYGINDEVDIEKFIESVKLANGTITQYGYECNLCEKISGTGKAMANIFEKSQDEELKKTLMNIFNHYESIFSISYNKKTLSNSYDAIIDLTNIPNVICRKIISLSNSIDKEINKKRTRLIKENRSRAKAQVQEFRGTLDKFTKPNIRK